MTDGCLPVGQVTEDGAASGISQRVEDVVQVMFNHLVEYICVRGDVQPVGRIIFVP